MISWLPKTQLKMSDNHNVGLTKIRPFPPYYQHGIQPKWA
jgi:hypothetical protein